MPAAYPEEFRRRAVELVRASESRCLLLLAGWGFRFSVCDGGFPRLRSTKVGCLGCPPKNAKS